MGYTRTVAAIQQCTKCKSPYYGDACPTCASDTEEPLPVRPGEVFRGMEILELLGRGGMGVVCKARQVSLDRLVALKILSPHIAKRPGIEERFAREAKALAALSHPNIVGVYDCGKERDLFYIVMEYVDGFTLRKPMVEKKITPDKAVKITMHVLRALEAAHAAGVIHRDIKPDNILIDRKGHVKVADFGLAKLTGADETMALTQSGALLGTARYMAPEQMGDPRSVNHRADIYSTGVVLYEMLTGEVPFVGFRPPGKGAELDPAVLRAVDRDPDKRFQSAAEFRKALIAAFEEGPALSAVETRRFVRGRMPWVLGAATAAVLCLGVGLGFALSGRKEGPLPEKKETRKPEEKKPPAFPSAGDPAILRGHESPVIAVAFHPKKRWLASGGTGELKLWDLDRRSEVRPMRRPHGFIHSLAFSPSGDTLVYGTNTGEVAIVDVESGELRKALSTEGDGIVSVSFRPDGRAVASAGMGGLRIWSVEGQELASEPGYSQVAFGPSLALADRGSVRLYDLLQKTTRPLVETGQLTHALAFHPQGRTLAAALGDGSIRVWTLEGRPVHELHGHSGEARSVAFSPDGRLLLSGGQDGTVRLWDAESGRELQLLRAHSGTVFWVTFDSSGTSFASCGQDRTIRVCPLR